MDNKIHILLADDDEDDRVLFVDVLKEVTSSLELTVAEDGQQAMERLHLQHLALPDIIFLDLNMPLKNGFDCLSEIRNDRNLQHVPVVIFSTSAQQTAIDRAYLGGASLYLRKPDTFLKLREMLERVLRMEKERRLTQPAREDFFVDL